MTLLFRNGSYHWRKTINGVPFFKSTKTGDKKLAESLATLWEAEAIKELLVKGTRPMNLHAVITAFLASKAGEVGAPNAEVHLRHFLALPDQRFADVNVTDLMGVINKRREAGTAHNTCVVTVGYWNAVVNYAESNNWTAAPKLETIKPTKTRLRYLSDDEELALLATIDPKGKYPGKCTRTDSARQDNTDLVIALLDLGCRYHEAAKMTWGQVDLKSGKVLVVRGKGGIDNTMILCNRLRAVFERRFAERTTSYVFPTKAKFNNAYKWLCDALVRAAIETDSGKVTLHTLRHTFATRMLKAGVSLVELQSLLGHRNIQSTMVYLHIETASAVEKAARILNDRHVAVA